ncbi:uncharacterized protein LTR77_006446 [Saxophila tyrrhenica]|uniref:Uncharacterized protein n=1 Tax=Saxophila tyrrhenica TaxID=1690608 RepID=A0AAV9P8H7_9PEZI|nr:hypothetical protein LTR77_006446 [Saxophila tyrrhenica]
MSRPAALWRSICSIDRLVGTIFGLPFGTAAHSFAPPQSVMVDGTVSPQELFRYIAVIAGKVQDIDESHVSGRSQNELDQKVWNVESELKTLISMTPSGWWTSKPERLVDHVLQYWTYYFTIRAHLRLALSGGSDSQHTYSSMACFQASRELAQRYVNLRGLLPPAFFAGRVLDLQALTGAVVLLFTSQRSSAPDESEPPSSHLVQGIIQTMESVSSHPTGVFSRQAAPALRALNELLSKSENADSAGLTLQIPMLGKINVSRHAKAAQPSASGTRYVQAPRPTSVPFSGQAIPGASQATDFSASGFASATDQIDWSLMMDLTFPGDANGIDQWMTYDSWDPTVF